MTGPVTPQFSADDAAELERLRTALQSAQVGTWDLDITHRQVWWDEQCKKLYGFGQGDIVTYDDVLAYIHEQDRQRVDEAVTWALNPQSAGNYDIRFRTTGAHDGQLRWLQCRGKAFFDEQGTAHRFAGTAVEITQEVQLREQIEQTQISLQAALEDLEQSNREVASALALSQEDRAYLQLLQDVVPAMIFYLDEGQRYQSYNKVFAEWFGVDQTEAIGQTTRQFLGEATYKQIAPRLAQAYAGQRVHYELKAPARICGGRWLDIVYTPHQLPDGRVRGIVVHATDITERKRAEQHLQQSETRLAGVIAAAPAGIGLFIGRDLIIESPNQTFIDIVGKGPGVEGLPLREAMPELLTEGQPFLKILDDVFTTGEAFLSPASLVKIRQNGVLNDNYYNISYTPLRDAMGTIYGILDIAIDVTQQVKVQQELARKSHELELAMAIGNMGTFSVDLPSHTTTYSDRIMNWFGLDQPGQPLSSLFERIHADERPGVIAAIEQSITGVNGGFHDMTYRITASLDGQVLYLRSLGQVLWEAETPVAMAGIIQDVTPMVNSRQVIEESRAALQGAVELAELATWRVDVPDGKVTYSERFHEWMGLGQQIQIEHAFDAVAPPDVAQVEAAYQVAIRPESTGRLEAEFAVTNAHTGRARQVHIVGQAHRDEQGQALSISGFAQDVTRQRAIQLALEQQVLQRTEELAASNKDLTTSNENLASANQEVVQINEQLLTSVNDLKRSNDSLQQFAYVASHDLQEPLRKIQSFGNLLLDQTNSALNEEHRFMLERMVDAGRRMSTLVSDLLTFSRISTRQQVFGLLSLQAILDDVVNTLDLTIGQTKAQIQREPLPAVNGDRTQLTQLFQNLLSNALKFVPAGQPPLIRIDYRQVDRGELPGGGQPASAAARFHQLSITDNGIGFDIKYLDRIFQVFQRLHSKNQYPGTGIGLAICQRVVENHGGLITASSQPGQGATFCVYLPA